MPYYRCPTCGVVSHSVSALASAGSCEQCGASLAGAARLFPRRSESARSIRRHLVAEPQAAYAARREVESLGDDLTDDELRRVELLVSELVTNAVLHSRMGREGVVRLDVIVTQQRIHVEVRDRGVGFEPVPRVSENPLDGHWGLELVEKLSDRWHVRGNTTVAFELDRAQAA